MMKSLLVASAMIALAAPIAPAAAQGGSNRDYNQDVREANREYRENLRDAKRERRERIRDWKQARRYDHNRYEQGQDGYYADRYYRESANYRTRNLSRNDRIYRGSDNRYYCRRRDGTTGLIVGGAVGGLLGNAIDGGRSSLLGTLIGAGAGAALGREVDRGRLRCR